MTTTNSTQPGETNSLPCRWQELAEQILRGVALTRDQGIAILRSNDSELLNLLAAAYRVRYRWFGNRVHLNFLINARSGMCGEDCGYCSQSKRSKAEIERYDHFNAETILTGAKLASERRSKTYCIAISGRAPSDRDIETIVRIVPQIKQQYGLKICLSPGLLTPPQAAQLKASGIDRINHNLNTSERHYSKICTTHSYQDRIKTLRTVRQAGLEICSGGIVGMGEEEEDLVELALQLGELEVEALPINFLIPIAGTPLEEMRRLNPRYCLKALALFRLANPRTELRIAAGREQHLGPLQPLGLYPANSISVGDYLTTKGQPAKDDYQMIEALGFEIVVEGSPTPQV